MTVRKLPNVPGGYSVSGRLPETFGRRDVRRLDVRRLPEDADLSVLATLPNLRSLTFERCRSVDVAALAGLPLVRLRFDGCSVVRLDGLQAACGLLEDLQVVRARDIETPAELCLPPRLRALLITSYVPTPAVEGFWAAAEWRGAQKLESLQVTVRSPPWARVDFGFLDALPALRRVQCRGVIDVSGAWREFVAARPEVENWGPWRAESQEALLAEEEQWPQPWQVDVEPGGVVSMYGSVCDVLEAEHDVDTEAGALRVLRRLVGDVDAGLLGRLKIDQESDGTSFTGDASDVAALRDLLLGWADDVAV